MSTVYEKTGPNDSLMDAQVIYENDDVYGNVGVSGDIDYYKITFNQKGKANFFLQPLASGLDVDLRVLTSGGATLGSSRAGAGSNDLVTVDVDAWITYYIEVQHYSGSGNVGQQYLLRAKNYTFNPSERTITFRGNSYTNKSPRDGETPIVIVDHITGTDSFTSTDDWFRSSGNQVSSAHFVIDRSGNIYQYVDMDYMAWANGNTDGFAAITSTVCRSKGSINPNKYTVSIEHCGTDGSLTSAQFDASVWLHKYIQYYVKNKFGFEIPFNRNYVIGHYEIAPISKPNCPGPNFPWTNLMNALK